VKNPEERLSADEILQHPWIISADTPDKILDQVPIRVKEYQARRRLRKAGHAVMALNKLTKILDRKKA